MNKFVKFGKKSHMKELIRGNFYLNPVSYFRHSDNTKIRDMQEGCDSLQQSNNKIFICNPNNPHALPIPSGELNLSTGEGITFWRNNLFEGNIFSMCKIDATLTKFNNEMLKFGESCVIFHNSTELLRRWNEIMVLKGLVWECREIQYYDSSKYSGNINIFKKRQKFSDESEVRIFVKTSGNMELSIPVKINDIAEYIDNPSNYYF